MLLRVAGLLLLSSPSTPAFLLLSTTSPTTRPILGLAELGLIADPEQGEFLEGRAHFQEVSSSAISGLIRPPIPYLPPPKVLGVAQPKAPYAVPVTAMLI